MKLAMVTTYATPRNVRGELLSTVIGRGHDVVVVAPESERVMSEPLARIGARYRHWDVSRTAIDPRRDARAAAQLLSILRAERPDVVLVYQVKAVLLGPLAAKLAGTPRVVALLNGLGTLFYEHGFGRTWKAKLARRAYAASLHAVDEIIFHNADDAAFMHDRGFLPRRAHRRVVLGSGVDLEKLAVQPPHIDPPTFTLVSRLLISKGVHELVAAARIVRPRHPTARFRLVGPLEAEDHPDAIHRSELDAWIAEGLVDYVGFTDEIPRVLRETTVYVLPSYREGMPRTNLEAAAVGRPVVTTDAPGCRDTVIDGVTGFVVPPRDTTTLAERLGRYLRDPTLVERHGLAGRALVEQKFDIRTINAAMCDALGV
jgi:glycosyltransferase involved in cell wall biosynthesis